MFVIITNAVALCCAGAPVSRRLAIGLGRALGRGAWELAGLDNTIVCTLWAASRSSIMLIITTAVAVFCHCVRGMARPIGGVD